MPTEIPTELTQSVAVVESDRNATKDLLQKLNAIIRTLKDHEARIDALEP
jgi:hypothetical protein